MSHLNGTGPQGKGAMTGRRGHRGINQTAQIELSEIQTGEHKNSFMVLEVEKHHSTAVEVTATVEINGLVFMMSNISRRKSFVIL